MRFTKNLQKRLVEHSGDISVQQPGDVDLGEVTPVIDLFAQRELQAVYRREAATWPGTIAVDQTRYADAVAVKLQRLSFRVKNLDNAPTSYATDATLTFELVLRVDTVSALHGTPTELSLVLDRWSQVVPANATETHIREYNVRCDIDRYATRYSTAAEVQADAQTRLKSLDVVVTETGSTSGTARSFDWLNLFFSLHY